MSKSSETGISSVMRRFIIGPEEEAFYVVSASEEVPVPEMETVSGNTLGGLSIEAGEVFEQVNQARAEIGLSELVWSDELAAAAEVTGGQRIARSYMEKILRRAISPQTVL